MGWGINIYDLVRVLVKKPCNGYYLRWYYNGWHYWFFQPGNLSVVTEGEKYYTFGTRKITMGTGQITRGQAIGIRTIMMTREIYLLTIAGWMNIRIEPGSLIVYDNKIAGAEIEFIAIIGSKEISYDTGFTPIPFVPIFTPDIAYCEIIIGIQIWMCKNYDTNYPGSKVYNDDEANRSVYGGLYTFNQIKNPGFCPSGWHVPTVAEWTTLINYLGTIANVGGFLKENTTYTHWDWPNTGAVDSVDFTALGNGFYISSYGGLKLAANLWTADAASSLDGYLMQMGNTTAGIVALSLPKSCYFGVRLLKDISAPPIIDIDGNIYTSKIIGTQEWLVENWKVNHVGSHIYDDDEANRAVYGGMYNRDMVDILTLPPGWRVPSKIDWDILIAYAENNGIPIGAGTSGLKLKEVGTAHWDTNAGTTNLHGLTLVGGGNRFFAVYQEKLFYADYWSSTHYDATNTYYKEFRSIDGTVTENWLDNNFWASVRLMRDI